MLCSIAVISNFIERGAVLKNKNGRLVILTGPSCVGKSPLSRALKKLYPNLSSTLKAFVLYNTRSPRPGEIEGVDYYFRTRNQVEEFRKDPDFVVIEVRGDLQALSISSLKKQLENGDVFFEGNPFVGRILKTHEKLSKIKKLGVFMSPLSKEEIIYLKDPEKNISFEDTLADVMRKKLLRRTKKQKGILSLADLENIEKRARSAYREIKEGHYFNYVIINHDGEDSENWDSFYYPISDAKKSLESFAALLKGETPSGIEVWEENIIP